MKEITFTAVYGDERKTVRASIPVGMGGPFWQVTIDNYFQGELFFRDGRWQAHLNARSLLGTDEIQILGEMIDQQNA